MKFSHNSQLRRIGCITFASRIISSSPRFSLPNDPLAYVSRAIYDLDTVRLANAQEPNHFHIHKSYFLQVQNAPRSGRLELLLQFANVLGLKASNQADGCLSAL
jgi:hypothetical protein